jgi:threonine synthase
MRYVSTRGQSPAVGFVDAVLGGLAPDGGLYMPEAWPTFSRAEIAGFADLSYAEVAAKVIGAFAGDEIEPAALLKMCREAYATFNHAAVVPLAQLRPGVFMAELFHGPSLAFKDVAMQILARSTTTCWATRAGCRPSFAPPRATPAERRSRPSAAAQT